MENDMYKNMDKDGYGYEDDKMRKGGMPEKEKVPDPRQDKPVSTERPVEKGCGDKY